MLCNRGCLKPYLALLPFFGGINLYAVCSEFKVLFTPRTPSLMLLNDILRRLEEVSLIEYLFA
jgi:hypothetical protein